jgi:hypothetical protein
MRWGIWLGSCASSGACGDSRNYFVMTVHANSDQNAQPVTCKPA